MAATFTLLCFTSRLDVGLLGVLAEVILRLRQLHVGLLQPSSDAADGDDGALLIQ